MVMKKIQVNRHNKKVFIYYELDSKSRIFLYSSLVLTILDLKDVKWKEPNEVTLMSVREFFHLANASTGNYVYFARPLEELATTLQNDLQPMEWLTIPVEGSKETSRMVWMGGGGVTAQVCQ